MDKKHWKTKIKKACKDAGTYKKYFEAVIETLAGILEMRDQAAEELAKEGEELLIDGSSRSGNTRLRNPLVKIWDDLNKSALAYWKELGLTPAGLKKLNEDTFVKEAARTNNLMDLIKKSKEEEKKNGGT